MRRSYAILSVVAIVCLVLTSCGSSAITSTPTPSASETPRPTRTPIPSRTGTPKPTQVPLTVSGKSFSLSEDGKSIVLMDYDNRYVVFLPFVSHPSQSITFTLQDPELPVSVPLPIYEGRFLAFSEITESYLSVYCRQSNTFSNVEDYLNVVGDLASTRTILTTNQGIDVGFTKIVNPMEDEPGVNFVFVYDIFFFIEGGFCFVSSSHTTKISTPLQEQFRIMMETIAQTIFMMDE